MPQIRIHRFPEVAYILTVLMSEAALYVLASGCGGYIDLADTGANKLTSPNYPGAYPNYTHCVWIMEAPSQYRINFTIGSFHGQSLDGVCADYIEIRDGSIDSNPVLNETCSALQDVSVVSTARWLRVLFKSDGNIATSGLNASYSTLYAGSSIEKYTSPIVECRTFEFECGNKQCLTKSYLCDGYNDCGCDINCDEDVCEESGLDHLAAIGMGISIGFAIFIVIFTVTFVVEQKLKHRAIKRNIKTTLEKSGANDPFLKSPQKGENNISRY